MSMGILSFCRERIKFLQAFSTLQKPDRRRSSRSPGCPAPCRQPAVSDYGSRLPVPRAASPRCPRTTGTRSPAIVRLLAEPLPAESPGHLQTAFLLFQNRCNLFRCVMILPARFSPPFATPARKTLSRDTKAPGARSARLNGNSPICGFPCRGMAASDLFLGVTSLQDVR